jgi:Arc/MetJ-type ribon-helix-helix transcriptional regulator
MADHQQMNVRMALKDLQLIDDAVRNGEAMNRADFVRSAVREKALQLRKQTELASQC